MKEGAKLENQDVDGRILKWILKKHDGKAWAVFIWLGIETSGRQLSILFSVDSQ
jgi:hypothetical protein